jgi:protein-S-isoprenylcysteine O-methyltransferase Ste14
MEKLIVFGILSLPVILISWRTLFSLRSHGFYRFFSWECILWLLVSNYSFWFENPFGIRQIFSWVFLFYSIYLVLAGTLLLKKAAKAKKTRNDEKLFSFEKTTELIETGIFKYIRHPLYSSLLFLTWGIYLKNTTGLLMVISLSSSAFLYLTARFDEKECTAFFGEKYRDYMKRTKRFIPFVL